MLARPDRLKNLIPKGTRKWIIIDEVQKVPELLNEVHWLIENRNHHFILIGSSARKLRQKGINLLAGRALNYKIYPLIYQELGEDFDLAQATRYGLLPAIKSTHDPEKYLENYVETYIREEVQEEGLTRNIAKFSRFLEVARFSQGSTLNYSSIAREIGENRLLVKNYFDILEDLLIGYTLPAFTKRAKRRVVHTSKFYFFDVGVYRQLRPLGPLDPIEESEGIGIETLFLQSLRAVNEYYNLKYKIYYWATTTGQEINFILYGPRGLNAFKVKRKRNVTGKHLRALRNFKNDYPEATLYLIYSGSLEEFHDDVRVLPLEQALALLPNLLE